MKDCCHCQGIELLFDRESADRELKEYHRKGAAKTTRLLVDALRAEGVQGTTLLDIGGGIGVIQYELIKAGASHATSVEASRAYVEAARQEASRQSLSERIRFHHGNFIDLAADIPPADVVTLDRVICCYPDMPALVGASAARALRLYGLVYPRDSWWVKLGVKIGNIFLRVQGNPFRGFVHPAEAVEAVLKRIGFERRFLVQTFIWKVAVYTRV